MIFKQIKWNLLQQYYVSSTVRSWKIRDNSMGVEKLKQVMKKYLSLHYTVSQQQC